MDTAHRSPPSTSAWPTVMLSTTMLLQWSLLTAFMGSQPVYGASLNSNYDLNGARQSHQSHAVLPLCSDQFVHEHEVHASLTLDLRPNVAVPGPCKTVLTAPDSNVFIVRLHRIRPQRSRLLPAAANAPAASAAAAMASAVGGGNGAGSTGSSTNGTRSCPLSIISTSDPLKSPWKIDPCLLEDMTAGMSVAHDDPVQLLPGRLRIIWHHGGNAPNYRLIVTALGKGSSCLQNGKHACLRFGSEIMLCISDALVCDSIRHCPTGNGYESDEDPEMCLRHKAMQPTHSPPSEMGLWEQISNELKKIIPTTSVDTSASGTGATAADATTDNAAKASRKPDRMTAPSSSSTSSSSSSSSPSSGPASTTSSTASGSSSHDVHRSKEARERTNLTRGLARYGPWGYLMLGMLLCGGALLMCGMWECCCRTKKPDPNGDDPVIVSNTSADGANSSAMATHNGTAVTEPPNYDEIDPPPSYAVLFPNQKSESSSASNADVSAVSTAPAVALATSTVTDLTTPTTTTTTTTSLDRRHVNHSIPTTSTSTSSSTAPRPQ